MGDEGVGLFSLAPELGSTGEVVRSSCWVGMRKCFLLEGGTFASTSKMPMDTCWNPMATAARRGGQACFAQQDVPLTRNLQAEVGESAVRASEEGIAVD